MASVKSYMRWAGADRREVLKNVPNMAWMKQWKNSDDAELIDERETKSQLDEGCRAEDP